MKKLFTAIRNNDIETVTALLDKKPELINCVAKQPPKKDDGQSPLQVALKCGMNDIAMLLLDRGADVNFIEGEDCCNEWRMPVVQCAIQSAVMQSRWNTCDGIFGLKVFSTAEAADQSYAICKRILEMGADISRPDSYGNSALDRAILDAQQILPQSDADTSRKLTKALASDLGRIFALLKEYGAAETRIPVSEDSPLKKIM